MNQKNDKDTVFHGILNSNLPEAEKTTARLKQDAKVLVHAGQDTVGKYFYRVNIETFLNSISLHACGHHVSSSRQCRCIEEVENGTH